MVLDTKPLDQLAEADLEALRTDAVPEGKTLDYKAVLPGRTDDERKEFLYDVSSFANAAGGHLLFGVREDAGVPVGIDGVELVDADAEIARLDNMLRDGIQPRIAGVTFRPIALQTGRVALLLRIPRSWDAPHMVTFKGVTRFFSRTAVGKYPLDVQELRAAFVGSAERSGRIRAFRAERLASIVADQLPAVIMAGPRVVLHVVPASSLDLGARIDASAFPSVKNMLAPIAAQGWNPRYNFDGYATIESARDHQGSHGYVQLFRNGAIEAVDSGLLQPFHDGARAVPAVDLEEHLIRDTTTYFTVLRSLGADSPVVVMLALLGVRGYTIGAGGEPIDRDDLVFTDVVADSFDAPLASVLRPLFDDLWNAAGFAGSPNYDEHGQWRAQR